MAITARTCFNPRTPCGVRPVTPGAIRRTYRFQSTHSLRSATVGIGQEVNGSLVSIHALLAECDMTSWSGNSALMVSIHALLAECDMFSIVYDPENSGFNPRTPCGVRLPRPALMLLISCFNPRTPCGVRLRLTIYIVIQQRKRYFAPTSRRRPSSPSLLF